MSPHARLAVLADELEQTMRELGAWSTPAPPLLPFRLPFAMDTMPFEHWLQLVLVPRLREIAASGERMPPRSNLAAHAVREFDGCDNRDALVDVLRRIDELSPEPGYTSAPIPGSGRRLGLAIAMMGLVSAWAVVAVSLATRLAPALPFLSQPQVLQTFTGTTAPGDAYQPLRITVSALVDGDDTIRATDASVVLLRSMRTMTRGPTAPLDFAMNERPTQAAVLDWLADFGVDEHAGPAHAAAREALAIVDAAARARTAAALHAAAADVDPHVTSDDLLRIAARTPGWVELALVPILVLAGALPILGVVLRIARRP